MGETRISDPFAAMRLWRIDSTCSNRSTRGDPCEAQARQAAFSGINNVHPTEKIPASFQFDDRHLDLVKAAAIKAQKAAVAAGKLNQSSSAENSQLQAAGKRDRSDAAGVLLQALPTLIKRSRGRPRKSSNAASPARSATVDAAGGSALAVEELEGAEAAGAEVVEGRSDRSGDESLDGASGSGVCASGDASAAVAAQVDIPSAAATTASTAAAAAAAAPAHNSHHRRGGYSRPMYEFMEAAASFYTIGSSAHTSDVQKMHEHARECRDGSTENLKRSIVAALRSAATDFETASASADRYGDDLLEVDVSEALLTAVQLRQEADALERRTLDDIRAELIAIQGVSSDMIWGPLKIWSVLVIVVTPHLQ